MALVTFTVSHRRLTVYCISLKCVIAASKVAVVKQMSLIEKEKWPIFKNVSVVKSETLIVDDCAALEKQNPSASRRGGDTGEASSQN